MALIQCSFFSEILGLSVNMNVILPQETQAQIGMTGFSGKGKHPTLWLLHGLSDDHTILGAAVPLLSGTRQNTDLRW